LHKYDLYVYMITHVHLQMHTIYLKSQIIHTRASTTCYSDKSPSSGRH